MERLSAKKESCPASLHRCNPRLRCIGNDSSCVARQENRCCNSSSSRCGCLYCFRCGNLALHYVEMPEMFPSIHWSLRWIFIPAKEMLLLRPSHWSRLPPSARGRLTRSPCCLLGSGIAYHIYFQRKRFTGRRDGYESHPAHIVVEK